MDLIQPMFDQTDLTTNEHGELLFLENRIEQALDVATAASLTIATCLRDIHAKRLYKAYGTFELYCRERWQKGRRWGYQLIEAAQVLDTLADDAAVRNCAQSLPTNEAQIRPLAQLPPAQQPEAWHRANELAESEGVPVTARHVDQAVDAMTAPSVFITNTLDPIPVAVTTTDPPRAYSMMPVMSSSASPEWYTPKHILTAVEAVLGPIDLDPCSNPPPYSVPAARHYTQADNGLLLPWQAATLFMNPPYGDVIGQWVDRLVTAYETGEVGAAIALVPGRIDTQWFQALYAYPLCCVRGRLRFSEGDSAPFPSVLAYLGPGPDRFIAVFRAIGPIVQRIDLGE